MNNNDNNVRGKWMRLSEAADYIGVHFTTLRRWTDAGEISYLVDNLVWDENYGTVDDWYKCSLANNLAGIDTGNSVDNCKPYIFKMNIQLSFQAVIN